MLEIRKLFTAIEETRIENDKKVDDPIKMIAIIAVFKNPWSDQGYVEDLMPKINEYAPKIGETLVNELFKIISTPDEVEAFGKAGVVGVNGDIEHASAFIHTLKFGNKLRDSVKGTSYLSFTNKRGGPGTAIIIPMVHKADSSKRSHYLTFETRIEDAPREDEIIAAIGVSTGGRPFPRIGDRNQDMKEMGLLK